MGKNSNFIKFLGTAGARFVMIRQLRSSAGLWLKYKSTNLLIDPGPGCLVRCHSCRPKLDPSKLDGIILTHKHLDHSGDINVMIEAMTAGGFKKRGKLFVTSDALGKEGVVFKYLEKKVGKIERLKKKKFKVKDIDFSAPIRNMHSVETYGVKFYLGGQVVAYISDTKKFDKLVKAYSDSTVLILNVVFYEPKPGYGHLSLPEAIGLVKEIKPKKTIFTHFGMTILRQKPYELEKKVRSETGLDIKFAYDGMSLAI
ncbi:MAG: MBL fold metallo-hydrolase [Candidatus Omnitrophica bacterium]|nr:MBL fold metallo-hydrolase [Candidatus Omnitrophota bacterium]MCF7877377.1 MBL fold metallo-hydrolase [Candidatus Omnitrophota bacterium]MCF7878837.1 MBL fold metallo-hydrolase [Candidatus Omnitrophota bacterium]MCF7893100.1 MBL fold metallo-hydrolase [Candidatus Omnitrophota bacterium]